MFYCQQLYSLVIYNACNDFPSSIYFPRSRMIPKHIPSLLWSLESDEPYMYYGSIWVHNLIIYLPPTVAVIISNAKTNYFQPAITQLSDIMPASRRCAFKSQITDSPLSKLCCKLTAIGGLQPDPTSDTNVTWQSFIDPSSPRFIQYVEVS